MAIGDFAIGFRAISGPQEVSEVTATLAVSVPAADVERTPSTGINELVHAVSAVQTGASPSFSVTVPSASDRMMVVAIFAPYDQAAFTAVTLGGNALAFATDGTTEAHLNDSTGFNSIQFLLLREANFPSTGSQTLAVTTAGPGPEGYFVAWWILENVDQSANVIDAAIVTGAGDPISVSGLAATAAGQWVFAAAMATFPFTGSSLTINGNAANQVNVDNDPPSAFEAYWQAGHFETSGAGSITVSNDAAGAGGTNSAISFILGSTGSVGSSTATGTAAYNATLAVSAPAATMSGTGTVPSGVNATLAVSAPAATGSGTGTGRDNATLAVSAPAATASGTGTARVNATLAVSSPAATASGTGTTADQATLAVSAPAATASGSGTTTDNATLAVSAPAATASGTGTGRINAALAVSAPAATGAGTGTTTDQAALAVAAPAATASGSGTVRIDATLAAAAPAATLNGFGFSGDAVVALLGVSIPAATFAGSGVVPLAATLLVAAPAATASGTGSSSIASTLDAAVPAATLSGAGISTISSALAASIPAAFFTGTGTVPVSEIEATFIVALPAAVFFGIGQAGEQDPVSGSGEIVIAPVFTGVLELKRVENNDVTVSPVAVFELVIKDPSNQGN